VNIAQNKTKITFRTKIPQFAYSTFLKLLFSSRSSDVSIVSAKTLTNAGMNMGPVSSTCINLCHWYCIDVIYELPYAGNGGFDLSRPSELAEATTCIYCLIRLGGSTLTV